MGVKIKVGAVDKGTLDTAPVVPPPERLTSADAFFGRIGMRTYDGGLPGSVANYQRVRVQGYPCRSLLALWN